MRRVLVHRLAGLVGHRVPFVDDDDGGFHFFEDEPGHVRVLGGDAFRRVNQQERHVCALNGFERAQHAVFFHAHFDVSPPADAGRVNQRDGQRLPDDARVERVARGAGDGADDGALLAEDRIEQR